MSRMARLKPFFSCFHSNLMDGSCNLFLLLYRHLASGHGNFNFIIQKCHRVREACKGLWRRSGCNSASLMTRRRKLNKSQIENIWNVIHKMWRTLGRQGAFWKQFRPTPILLRPPIYILCTRNILDLNLLRAIYAPCHFAGTICTNEARVFTFLFKVGIW